MPVGRIVVQLEHVLEREVVDVHQDRFELRRPDRLGVAVDDLALHRDDQHFHLVAVLDPVDDLIIEVDVVERIGDQVLRLREHRGLDRGAGLGGEDDLLHDHRGSGHGGDHLGRLRSGLGHQRADRLDHRPFVLDHVGLDDRGRECGDPERGEPGRGTWLLNLGELDAARADVEDQEPGLPPEWITQLRAKDPLQQRTASQTCGERQGVVLPISLPPPVPARRRPKLQKSSRKARRNMRPVCGDVKG